MWMKGLKYRSSAGSLAILTLLFFNSPILSQSKKLFNPILDDHHKSNSISSQSGEQDTTLLSPEESSGIIPLTSDRTPVFYDSLKAKTSKYIVTRKIYDFLVVSGLTPVNKNISESSDQNYLDHTGKKIRNIKIQRLNVFGTNINAPLHYDPDRLDSLLNKTHLNTNEFIVRKNLLFSEGDTVSPLTLSDNERILRQLPYIDDSRIIIVPVSGNEVDIVVLTKDVYSLGATVNMSSIKKGSVSLFEKNTLGLGHEFRFEIPFDSELPDSPGFGINYNIKNLFKSFSDLSLFYHDGLGKKTYGFSLERSLISSLTRYAGGISIRQMSTTEDLDTLNIPEPLKYNLQDYWLARSFLLNKNTVTRMILGLRYTNNNVFDHPFILPHSYQDLQRYKMYLGSASLSTQKYYKTNLIYGYGRTEDIPHGGLINFTIGKEINEFKERMYTGLALSAGESFKKIGYIYASAGYSTYFNNGNAEQGQLEIGTNYFSNLLYLGNHRIRNFVKLDYRKGINRYQEEFLAFKKENGFMGFRNDSLGGTELVSLSLESVIFNPEFYYGFRLAYFIFADLGYLSGACKFDRIDGTLSAVGVGIRLRNDNLVLNTFQFRLGYFPNLPLYSKIRYLSVSGEQLLKPENFDPGPPAVHPFE